MESSSSSSSSSSSTSTSTSSSSSSIRFFVKTLKGGTFPIDLPSDTFASATVDALNAAIESSQSIPIEEQRLIYKGKVLKKDKLIAEYNMEDGDCLHLIVSTPKPAAPSTAESASADAAGVPSSGAASSQMPSLTPNNAIPNVPPSPFGFGGFAPQHVQIDIAQGPFPAGMFGANVPGVSAGAGGSAAPMNGMPIDLQAILQNVFGGIGGSIANMANLPGGAQAIHVNLGQPPMGGVPASASTSTSTSSSTTGASTSSATGSSTTASSTTSSAPSASVPSAGFPVGSLPPQTQVHNFTIDIQVPHPLSASPPAAAAGDASASQPSTGATSAPNQASGVAGANVPPLSSSPPTGPNAINIGMPGMPFNLPPGVHVAQGLPINLPSHPALSVNAVRQFLTEVGQNIPRLMSQPPISLDPRATLSNSAIQTSTFPESIAGVAELLTQTQAVLTQVSAPMLNRMQREVDRLAQPMPPTSSNSEDAPTVTPATRLALQSQLRQLTPGIRRIGDALRGLATLIEAIQVNPQTGESSLLILPLHLQPGRQVNITHLPMAIPGMSVNGQPFAMNQSQTQPQAQAQAQAQSSSTSAAPLFTQPTATPASAAPPAANAPSASTSAAPSQPAAAAPSSAAQPSAAGASSTQPNQPGQFNLMGLLQQAGPLLQPAGPMIGPLVMNLQQSVGQAAAAANGQQSNNPMAGIMSALGPMIAGLGNQAQAAMQAQPQAQPSAAQPTPPSAPAPSAATAQSTPAPAPAPTSSAAPSSGARLTAPPPAATSTAPPPQMPNMAGLFGSLMPMLGQMMNNPSAAGGGGSLQNIITNMMGAMNQPQSQSGSASNVDHSDVMDVDGDDEVLDVDDNSSSSDPPSLFDMFLSQMMSHLSMPDLMGLVSGNWSGLDRMHRPFREMMMDLLEDDDSNEKRELLTHSIAGGIIESALSEATLNEVADQLIDGQDPQRVSIPIVRKYVRKLIDIVLDTPIAPSTTSPSLNAPPSNEPFSVQLKAWCNRFIGEWLCALGDCYRNGLTSSQRIANLLVQSKFSAVGPELSMFLPMISGTLTQVMLRSAEAYRSEQLLDGANWLEHVPPEMRQRWKETIEADEKELQRRYQQRKAEQGSNATSDKPSLYRPLSSAYLSGTKGHKPSGASSAPGAASSSSTSSAAAAASSSVSAASSSSSSSISAAAQFGRDLQESIEASVGSSPSTSEVVTSITNELGEEYARQIQRDLTAQLQSQPRDDFKPEQYPNLTKLTSNK